MRNNVDIFVCGDIINQTADHQFIDSEILDIIQKSDYAICNFEGNCKLSIQQDKQMIQRPSTLKSLKEAGFDLLLLANNHITDYGLVGLKNTIEQINRYGFEYIGAGFSYKEAYKPKVIEINGLKVGIINLCEAQVGHFKCRRQQFGYAWLGDDKNDERIINLKKDVDFLIIIPHAGLENYPLPLLQFRQLYYHWCDLGADVIIGGHPHISQGIEHYGKSIIFYSLGNFFFSGINGDVKSWICGISCIIHLSEKNISYDIIQHQIDGEFVRIVNEDINNIKEKNAIMSNDMLYKEMLVKQNVSAFDDVIMKLYMSALNGTSSYDNIITKCKKIFFYLTNTKKLYNGSEMYRLSVLKRLTENETYRFLTISAIEDRLREI